jgi:cephalosporin-C deacetylase-like acetyl esterase/lysophospholipase L1-like esterase
MKIADLARRGEVGSLDKRMSKRKQLAAAFAASLFVLTAAPLCAAQQLTLTPYKASGIYAVGEKVGWTASLPPGATPAGDYSYVVRKNNLTVIKTGTINLSSGRATVEVTSDEPAMIYVQITPPAGDGPGRSMAVGAAVAPERLRPSVGRPADFDGFWASKIRSLIRVPANAVLKPSDSGKPGVEYATITLDNVNGAHVRGQLAKPKGPGKFPALVIFQWAGPPYPLQKQWVTDRAAEGWLALNIEPHDVLPDQPQSYYDALPQELKHYESIGREDRERNYFLQMYLADYRAVDYLSGRPDWDGRTLVVMGTSMGGQQSLAVAGLHPKITHLVVNEPAGCDTNGPLHGRASGYPNWPADNPRAMKTALYFDPVNFAPRIRATSLVAMGFVDTTAPPVGIWIAFDQIRGRKESAPMIDSPHNNSATPAQQRPYTDRSAQWLGTLVRGGRIKSEMGVRRAAPAGLSAREHGPELVAKGAAARAARPVPRADRNSVLAHAQLLEKAKRGGIDIYFEGDSITRRWGTSDEQYKEFLANWRQNFFGWNAADFGWGGDTTRNILWRLDDGELDNVNPRIIVLLAGTNDVGDAPPQGDNDPRIEETVEGIRAILETCRRKAPRATIVLMGITPRNDNAAVMPVINRINERIAKFADGKRIRYLSINDRLADRDGKLREGVANRDGLHLDVKGYQAWADALKPIFTELLGPPAKEDHAPPPTGDPSVRNRQ